MPEEIDTSTSQLPAEGDYPHLTGNELTIKADALPDRRYAAEKITDALPPAAYERLGQNALTLDDKQIAELELATPDDEIDIRPDNGAVYASHEYCRRKLNKVFGYMGWTLIPGSPLTARPGEKGQEVYQRWVLFVSGVYVAEALSSRRYYADNAQMDMSDVAEAIKSDALRRCCKDLGIATEAWNKRWIRTWKEKYAIEVIVQTNKGNVKQWRRRDGEPLRGEITSDGGQRNDTTSFVPSGSRQTVRAENAGQQIASKSTTSTQQPNYDRSSQFGENQNPSEMPNSANAKFSASSATAPKQAQNAEKIITVRATDTVATNVAANAAQPRTMNTTIPAGQSTQNTSAATGKGGMKITEGQIRLLWVKARNAKLVVDKDATLWIDWLHGHEGIDVPEVEGKTTEEVAAAMMREVQGSRFTKLLKDLDAMKAE